METVIKIKIKQARSYLMVLTANPHFAQQPAYNSTAILENVSHGVSMAIGGKGRSVLRLASPKIL